jgi:hypothetical protein
VALHGAMRGLRVAGFQCYKDIGVLANRFFCHARVKQQPREMHVGMQAGERLGVCIGTEVGPRQKLGECPETTAELGDGMGSRSAPIRTPS